MPKIIKAGFVTVDRENVVILEVAKSPRVEDGIDDLDVGFDFDADDEPCESEEEARKRQSEQLLDEARKEAEKIRRDAKAQAEKEAAKITDDAWEQGYQEGMDLASAEGDAVRAQAQKVLLDAWEERKTMLNAVESEIIDLIIKITGKLINDTVKINPQIIVALIKQGLSGSNLTGEVFVHVAQQDYDTVSAHKDELLALTESSTRLEIMKDPSLNGMDCVIETPFGNVDCSLNQGYESLAQNLTYLLNNK